MVDRIRDAQEAWLRDRVEEGSRCPFCLSTRLEVDRKLEVQKRGERSTPDYSPDPRPHEFMRVNCLDCGYVLLFKEPA